MYLFINSDGIFCFASLICANPSRPMNTLQKEQGQTAQHEQLCNLFYSNNESYTPLCLIVLVAFHLFFVICLKTLHLPLGWTLWITRDISKALNLTKHHRQSRHSTTKVVHCILTVKDFAVHKAAIDCCWFHFRSSSYFFSVMRR